MRIVCSPAAEARTATPNGSFGVVLFGRAKQPRSFGSVGAPILETLRREKLVAPQVAWDLLAIALSVFAADQAAPRGTSSDGWTRQIDVSVALRDPQLWVQHAGLIERQFQFLTTDVWRLQFIKNGLTAPTIKNPAFLGETTVSLLSGGLDSLIGAIDLGVAGTKPLLVSQVALGDRDRQSDFARSIAGGLRHLQLTHACTLPGDNERSTRSRSIIFLSYGVLAATMTEHYQTGHRVELYVPENGFISVNPPLNESRIGGLSTRTTHPVFVKLFQLLLDAVGVRVQLKTPYQFKTKGEMMLECRDQDYLRKHAHRTTSCGRFARNNFRHCGRCVPCLVRRAAFRKAKLRDRTEYVYKDLSRNDADHALFEDVRSAAMAILEVRDIGIDGWLGTSLVSELIQDTGPHKEVVRRGLDELGAFLKAARVL